MARRPVSARRAPDGAACRAGRGEEGIDRGPVESGQRREGIDQRPRTCRGQRDIERLPAADQPPDGIPAARAGAGGKLDPLQIRQVDEAAAQRTPDADAP
ncbi:MAG: hypothetical protein D6686_03310, partial [Alphaproteobacteria bacterium]